MTENTAKAATHHMHLVYLVVLSRNHSVFLLLCWMTYFLDFKHIQQVHQKVRGRT